MHVRVVTDNGDISDFEFEFEFLRLTPQIKRVIRNVIFEETGIQPEKQTAFFVPELPEPRNLKKLSLPSDVERLDQAPVHQIAQLGEKYPEIFDQSTVYVSTIGDWKEDDLRKPENHIEINRNVRNAGTFLRTLYRELDKPRTVDTSLLDQFPDFREVIEQDLRDFLTPTASATSGADVTPIELRCYVDIFRSIVDGVEKFKSRKFDSSPLHTIFFGSLMIQPPFFWEEHDLLKKLEMASDCASGLRLFVKTSDQSDVYKFAPRSDLAVIDKLSSLPALVSEVDSNVAKKDRTRMIFQGVVSCRQWRYTLPETLKEKNRLLGLFIHKDFVVDMYLFHSDNEYNVEIFQQAFFLGEPSEALRLARVLFNYRNKFLDVAGLSVLEKIKQIEKLVSDTKAFPSFTTSKKNGPSRNSRQSSKQPSLATIPEAHTDALLLSAEVQSRLCPSGAYLQATEHEYVAAIRMTGITPKTLGFVKLTNKHELRTFDAIRNSGSEFLISRVVLPTEVIEVSGYSVAFLPYGGEPLHKSWGLQDGPVGHETEIAWDLLTIISRLHDLRIAHLDIKPANILWDASTRSIRVIDFDSSEGLDPNGNGKIRGVFGTSGYAAPEVESAEGLDYDPFLADAFSCGQVLSDLVMAAKMTEEARFVLEISKFLSNEDVNKRWSISKAKKTWQEWFKEHGRKPGDWHMADSSRLSGGMLPLLTVCVH